MTPVQLTILGAFIGVLLWHLIKWLIPRVMRFGYYTLVGLGPLFAPVIVAILVAFVLGFFTGRYTRL